MPPEIDVLLERASEAAGGLDDPGDPSFVDGLRVFLDSTGRDGGLNAIGEAAVDGLVLDSLVNRLRVTDWHRRHPELTATEVEAPLMLIGLPRTGTTALSHLLSVDPANRSLLGWEANASVPPPTTATYRTDERFVAAMEAPDLLGMINPGFKAIHHDPPDMPVECAVLLGQHFRSLHLATMFNIEGYMEWLLGVDHAPAYAHHRAVLQILQSDCPGQWQLKSPVHLLDPWSLDTTYPDATYVLTHRDPLDVVASVCSLVRSLTSTFSDEDRTDEIRRRWPEVIGILLDRQSRFRDDLVAAGQGDAFIDIAYRDVVADSTGVVAEIYRRMGRPLSDAAIAAMESHRSVHRQGRFGRHTYSLEDWGLSRGELAERFSSYRSRYAEFLEDS